MTSLFETQLLGGTVPLKNRIVMPPMTRTRTSEGGLPTDGDLPNELIATYYGQRASAGLIIAEAADVDQSSHGYARTPGIHSHAQLQGWRLVTDEVQPSWRNDLSAVVARRKDGAFLHFAERPGPGGRYRAAGGRGVSFRPRTGRPVRLYACGNAKAPQHG